MTLAEFVTKYKGQHIEFDGLYLYQCVDLVQLYNKEVIGAPPLKGNAKEYANNPRSDFYEYKINYLWYIPPRGSIAVWGGNLGAGFGHVSVVLEASLTKFTSLDQNWPTGAPVTEVLHIYSNVLGFLVPRSNDVTSIHNALVLDLQRLVGIYQMI